MKGFEECGDFVFGADGDTNHRGEAEGFAGADNDAKFE